jgi:hypothetical protein
VATDLNLDTGLEPASAPAFDAVEALSAFCRLVRRSRSLDGSLPMRALQHCPPVVHGSAAGFQVVLDQPITLHRGCTGVVVTLTRPGPKTRYPSLTSRRMSATIRTEPESRSGLGMR